MSDILIKGMEMPYNCGHCFLRRGECKERIYMPNRPSNCPLIPVPDHGDLIDRDMVLEKAWDVETFVDAVKCAPTIIPADKESGE